MSKVAAQVWRRRESEPRLWKPHPYRGRSTKQDALTLVGPSTVSVLGELVRPRRVRRKVRT